MTVLFHFVSIRLLFFSGKAERLARGLRPKNGETHWGDTLGRHNGETQRGNTTGKHNGETQRENDAK